MDEERHEVVLAGIGGSGVVYAGTLLARAGTRKFPYVTRFPNFTTAMRGGPCECMVIFSTREISCPLVAQGDILVVMENTQLKPFQDRVRPGGLILVENTNLREKPDRDDVRVIEVPAIAVATSLGDTLVSNLVMVGAYIGVSGVLPPELIEREIEARFGVTETGISAVEKLPLLERNLEAFRRGLEWGTREASKAA